MTPLLESASILVVVALLMTLMPLGVLAYYSTGAPAARHELYSTAAAQILRLNGGPITVAQRARGFGSSLWRGLNPFRWTTVDYPGWAHSVVTEARRTEDDDERAAVYSLIARAASDVDGVTGLTAREERLIASAVGHDELNSAATLEQLHSAFGRQQRGRRRTLLRRPAEWVDVGILGPVIGRGLDYIGRGTTVGLLVGALFSTTRDMSSIVEIVGLTSLLGGALGSVLFAGYLIKLLPAPSTAAKPNLVQRVYRRHPYWSAAVLPIVITAALKIALDAGVLGRPPG